MIDGPIRRGVKRFGLGVYHVRLWLHRSQADIRYELGGECIRCAKCCEEPGIQVSKLTWYFPFARHVFVWWHGRVNGFELIEARRKDKAFIFKCTHFDEATRSCDSYDSRPGMCRDYPRALLNGPIPDFFEECGYRSTPRDGDRLLAALRKRGITGARLAEVRARLGIRDDAE
jgi:Fe-S-cluster containining protein